MKKGAIKKTRNKMIRDLWEQKKAEWTMADLASLFNLSLIQIFRILKVESKKESENKSDFSI